MSFNYNLKSSSSDRNVSPVNVFREELVGNIFFIKINVSLSLGLSSAVATFRQVGKLGTSATNSIRYFKTILTVSVSALWYTFILWQLLGKLNVTITTWQSPTSWFVSGWCRAIRIVCYANLLLRPATSSCSSSADRRSLGARLLWGLLPAGRMQGIWQW